MGPVGPIGPMSPQAAPRKTPLLWSIPQEKNSTIAPQQEHLSHEETCQSDAHPADKLLDLEEDNYSNFPSMAYAKGFLLLYARFLGIDHPGILPFPFSAPNPVSTDDYEYSSNAAASGPAPPPSRRPLSLRPPARARVPADCRLRGAPWTSAWSSSSRFPSSGSGTSRRVARRKRTSPRRRPASSPGISTLPAPEPARRGRGHSHRHTRSRSFGPTSPQPPSGGCWEPSPAPLISSIGRRPFRRPRLPRSIRAARCAGPSRCSPAPPGAGRRTRQAPVRNYPSSPRSRPQRAREARRHPPVRKTMVTFARMWQIRSGWLYPGDEQLERPQVLDSGPGTRPRSRLPRTASQSPRGNRKSKSNEPWRANLTWPDPGGRKSTRRRRRGAGSFGVKVRPYKAQEFSPVSERGIEPRPEKAASRRTSDTRGGACAAGEDRDDFLGVRKEPRGRRGSVGDAVGAGCLSLQMPPKPMSSW